MSGFSGYFLQPPLRGCREEVLLHMEAHSLNLCTWKLTDLSCTHRCGVVRFNMQERSLTPKPSIPLLSAAPNISHIYKLASLTATGASLPRSCWPLQRGARLPCAPFSRLECWLDWDVCILETPSHSTQNHDVIPAMVWLSHATKASEQVLRNLAFVQSRHL